MIDIKTAIMIGGFLITLGGILAAYVKMQTAQNMRLERQDEIVKETKQQAKDDINGVRESLEREIEELKRKQSLTTTNQIKTEKALGILMTKMDRLLKDMDELKSTGCGRCHDGTV